MKIQSTLLIWASLLTGWQVLPAAELLTGYAKEAAAIAGADLEKAAVTVPYSQLKRLRLKSGFGWFAVRSILLPKA